MPVDHPSVDQFVRSQDVAAITFVARPTLSDSTLNYVMRVPETKLLSDIPALLDAEVREAQPLALWRKAVDDFEREIAAAQSEAAEHAASSW